MDKRFGAALAHMQLKNRHSKTASFSLYVNEFFLVNTHGLLLVLIHA